MIQNIKIPSYPQALQRKFRNMDENESFNIQFINKLNSKSFSNDHEFSSLFFSFTDRNRVLWMKYSTKFAISCFNF